MIQIRLLIHNECKAGKGGRLQTLNLGPDDQDPRTRGPGTRNPRTQSLEGLYCTVAVKIQLDRLSAHTNVMSLTHGYRLVHLHTEGAIYTRQCYFKLFSDFFDLQSSLLSVLQSQAYTHIN